MNTSVAPLAGRYRGPILVVGGGIQTLNDLRKLGKRRYIAILSANDHAFKIPTLPVDFIVCKDYRHTETGERMEDRLRAYNTPIISRQWWADYRLPDWNLQGNSGLTAIAVAIILGGGPIYPVGFDCYQEGTYWHDPHAKNVSRGYSAADTRRQVFKLAEASLGTQIRPVSGLLTEIFKPFNPAESTQAYLPPAIVTKYRNMKGLPVRARREFTLRFDSQSPIQVGDKFWMSETEFKMPNGYENVEPLDNSL